jgi:uncharacterized protein YabN with tetrapyrrole methylase and pyrophosphatase domain
MTAAWVRKTNSTTESLHSLYAPGKNRQETYGEMVEAMLRPVRQGRRVCAVFYGHPGVFVNPTHVAIAKARSEGFRAVMFPGVSAEDCLFADLGVDPAVAGCQSYEATYFLIQTRAPNPEAHLILWQVGVIGQLDYRLKYGREHLALLRDELLRSYSPDHVVTLYEAAQYPTQAPRADGVRLAELAGRDTTATTTLYVPPIGVAEWDATMMTRLGITSTWRRARGRDESRPHQRA